MTPPIPLIDTHLERMFVAAVLADPIQLTSLDDFAVVDLGDFHAIAAFTSIRNLQSGGLPVDLESVRAELLSREIAGAARQPPSHPPSWLDKLAAISLPDSPPVIAWARQLIDLAAARDAALVSAEPKPARPPRGPRAENVEPTRLAEAFRRFCYQTDGAPTLVRWARAWWRYNGARYVEHDDELLDRDVIGFLDVCVAPQEVRDPKTGLVRVVLRRVTSKNKTLAEVRKALLLAIPTVDGSTPQWTSSEPGDPPAEKLIAVTNGLLHVGTREIHPSTPRFFATTSVDAAWDPDAAPPSQWLAFLASLWPKDNESIRALQQIFGYLLTADTSHQKLFALIGPPRSGKGTIARVLRALLGDDAVVNPTLQSLERPFGLAPLVGKTLAVIGDARLGGKSDQAQVVERLLSISGEDGLSIDRKNRDPINVRLKCRVLLLSNELPRLYDTSGALASRFLILCLSHSFLGSEDVGLEAKLLAELPGILRWALDGRDDLAEAGRFLSPEASEAAQAHLQAISNPLGVFLEDCCKIGSPYEVEVGAIYDRYKTWCTANGRDPANRQVFSRDLHTLHPAITTTQGRNGAGVRIRVFNGISCNA